MGWIERKERKGNGNRERESVCVCTHTVNYKKSPLLLLETSQLLLGHLPRLLLHGAEQLGMGWLVGVLTDLRQGDQLIGETVGTTGLGVKANLKKSIFSVIVSSARS